MLLPQRVLVIREANAPPRNKDRFANVFNGIKSPLVFVIIFKVLIELSIYVCISMHLLINAHVSGLWVETYTDWENMEMLQCELELKKNSFFDSRHYK